MSAKSSAQTVEALAATSKPTPARTTARAMREAVKESGKTESTMTRTVEKMPRC